MTIINENTVVVFSYAELKSALEGNNAYNYIYFGNNIVLTAGITISKTKTSIIIDGTYNGVEYTYQDMKSASTNDTISARDKNIQQVTVKNMKVTGYNYYGLIYVPEDTSLQNMIITYDHVTYKGPQITFHPTGLSIYMDCNITITTNYLTANEVAECNRIEIGGNTTIMHTSTGDSMFWFRGNVRPYFKILKGAKATLTSQSRELFYGVNNLSFEVEEGANFIFTTSNGMGYGNYSTNQVLIDKEATVKITQTKQNGSNPTWYCNGPFVMNENSSLYMECYNSGLSTSNYCLSFTTTNSSLTLNNPKRIVLYNNKANVIYSDSNINFALQYTRINMWNQATAINVAGSLDNLPSFSWYKTIDLSSVKGILSRTTTTIQSQNYTDEELAKLPALTNFTFQGKKALSIGKMILNINALTDTDITIKGYTEALSDIQLTYNKTITRVSADVNGYFEYNLGSTLPIGTIVQFLANVKNSFIYQSKEIQVVYPGELTLDQAPQIIKFAMQPYSINPVLCPRSTDLEIMVTDTRINSTDFQLYASINHSLLSKNGKVLTDSLVYINSNKEITPLSTNPIVVYQGEKNNGVTKITTISWNEDEGIILRVANEPLDNGEEYSTIITWSLKE